MPTFTPIPCPIQSTHNESGGGTPVISRPQTNQIGRAFPHCGPRRRSLPPHLGFHDMLISIGICSGAYYSPHTHSGLTTHLVLDGELTISFPEDEIPEKKTYGVGERIDVEAERLHEVWIGKSGCTYVIGE